MNKAATMAVVPWGATGVLTDAQLAGVRNALRETLWIIWRAAYLLICRPCGMSADDALRIIMRGADKEDRAAAA
jgi:hypothetical protein